jgi:hypothetical protein
MSQTITRGNDERLTASAASAHIVTTMAKSTVIEIGYAERHWAHSSAARSWQRFWGKYERHAETGLFIEYGSDPEQIEKLARAFRKLPQALQEVCLEWRVTFSFAEGFTANGNSSTFYADFSQSTPTRVSPHIEIGIVSMQPNFIVPHLAHELSHLFWRSRREFERNAYRSFLRETCQNGCIEVTKYVHDIFLDRQYECEARRWMEESFCETVAVLVAPTYPAFNAQTTVDLNSRREAMADAFGLQLPPRLQTVD